MARMANEKKAARKARTLRNDKPGHPRQGLSADALFALVRERFETDLPPKVCTTSET